MSTESHAEGSRTATPFHDLADFVSIPRVTALRLAPDGNWLAAAVQTLSPDRKKYLTSLWRIDTGGGPPRRLTRSAEGEANPRFLPDGSLLFTSRRPDPAASPGGPAGSAGSAGRPGAAALWVLPPGAGEARIVAALPGGVTAAASQLPSGASRKAVTRGIATKSARSWNGVLVWLLSAGDSALTVTPITLISRIPDHTPRQPGPVRALRHQWLWLANG